MTDSALAVQLFASQHKNVACLVAGATNVLLSVVHNVVGVVGGSENCYCACQCFVQ